MADNLGKAWEERFKQDWKTSFPGGTLDRLYDPMGGMQGVHNVSDFIGYVYPNIFYLECKSHKKKSFPFAALSQYDKLVGKVGIKGVRAGVVLWMIDLDEIYYVPISTITKIKNAGIKSFNPYTLDRTDYKFYDVPAEKLRVFSKCDWSFLSQLLEGE